ncbi:MAG: isochorismate synthase DhbC [Gammaproteobacteria bacterium]
MGETLEIANDISLLSENLLDEYQSSSSIFFSSSTQALLAKPPFASLLVAGMKNLPEQVNESLRLAEELGCNDSIVIGAIPFNIKEPNYLRVSTNFRTAYVSRHKNTELEEVDVGEYRIKSYPTSREYIDNVKNALQRFASGELDKVVLSRTLEIKCDKSPDISALVKNLDARNKHGYTFAVNLCDIKKNCQDGEFRTLIGASPELLISRIGNKIIANPLAGSEPRSKNNEIDKIRAQNLMTSDKDRYEHALVVKAIEQALSPFCKHLDVPDNPSLISTGTLWHLSTRIEGELNDTETSSLTLALALHPTPAVCGYPVEAAANAITQLEPHERNLFTGMVGWCNAAGDGEWVVTIRCAEVSDKSIRLYAGAGIVEGSDPDKELNETEAKFSTMRNALGI